MIRILQFFALVLTALCLVPEGAHLLEISAKIRLGQADYLVAQRLYRGWALSGIPLFGAVVVDAMLALKVRAQPAAFYWVAASGALTAVTIVSFFALVYPINLATADWTMAPANWMELRARWEYAHAINAVLALLSLVAMIIGNLAWRD